MLIGERHLLKKNLLQGGRLFESGRKIEHLPYILYIESRLHTNQTWNYRFRCIAWFSLIVFDDNRGLLEYSTVNDKKPYQR